ncbi:MAG: hypothetical protein LIP00_09230 [Parabacteroides sp.]|nr:hypothetical protein [Parabacteroides sp.]
MTEYILLGIALILAGLFCRKYPDTITRTLMFVSRHPMRIERWHFVWRFFGKYLIMGGIVLAAAGIYLHFAHAYL